MTHAPDHKPLPSHARPEWRSPGAIMLCALVAFAVSSPFLDTLPRGDLIEAVLVTTILAAGAAAVVRSRVTFLIILGLAAVAVVARWAHYLNPAAVAELTYLIASTLALVFITVQFMRAVMTARRVDGHMLCLGVASFFILAMCWASAYVLIEKASPGSFTISYGDPPERVMRGFTALYFSLVTLCTVGFGDIVPVSDGARMVAMLEGAAGVFYLGIMISRLVSLYTSASAGDERDGPDA